uniref:HELICc2 domain-containing protein n=1 Tax=Macrostomum lignano TaxID=282301 RepID=A0A1I8JRN3_9PLAT
SQSGNISGSRDQLCHQRRRPTSLESNAAKMPLRLSPATIVRSWRRNRLIITGRRRSLKRSYNIEQVCEDGASVELSSVDLAQCIFEIDAAVSGLMKKITADQQASSLSLEDLSGAEAQESLDFTVSDLFALKGQLLALEKAIDSIPLGSGDSAGPGFTKPGAYVLELLAQADITAPRVAHMLDRLDKILAFMSSTQGRLFRGTGLSRLSEFIAGVFPQSSYCDPAVSSASGSSSSSSSGSSTQRRRGLPSSSSGLAQCYKLHIREVSGGHYGRSGATSAPAATVAASTPTPPPPLQADRRLGKPYRLLSYWCFSPAKAMLEPGSPRGTLYPMEALRQDLQLPFPIELSNPAPVVPRGPNSVRLSSGYENRDSLDYQRALGECVASLCGCVPHGLLVFFPSYSLMSRCLDAWRSSRLFDRISSRKPVFVEPLSEGLDFADHFGRAVVVTGLPYPMWTDPRVRLKQAWLDEQRLATGRGLTGKQWLVQSQQAYRAVQPGHRVAYCRTETTTALLLLCDERFATEESRRQLPAWLQHSVVTVAQNMAENAPAGQATADAVRRPVGRPPFEFGSAATHQLKAQAGAGPVYGSSVSPLIGGGRAGTVIEFLHTATRNGAQNSVQTPSEERLLQASRKALPAVRSTGSPSRRSPPPSLKPTPPPLSSKTAISKCRSRRRQILSATLANLRSVAKSSLSPSPSPSATPKADTSLAFKSVFKASPPSPDAVRTSADSSTSSRPRLNGADSGRPWPSTNPRAELTADAGWPRCIPPRSGRLPAGGPRFGRQPAALRQSADRTRPAASGDAGTAGPLMSSAL